MKFESQIKNIEHKTARNGKPYAAIKFLNGESVTFFKDIETWPEVGDITECEYTMNGQYKNGESIKVVTPAEQAPPIPEEEKKSWAEDITNFETLLNEAHKKFGDKLSIETFSESVDFEKKTAVFKATVSVGNQVFDAHGDATMENVANDNIKPHFIRMAETRAIARALRWATNNAKVASEELSDGKPLDPVMETVMNE